MEDTPLLERLLSVDRRIIYSLVFLAVAIPFYVDWPPIRVDVSKEVEDAFQTIDQIEPNSDPVIISIDYDPAAEAELTPMARAVLHHCFSKDIRVLVLSLQYTGQGAGIASQIVPEIAEEYGKVQNVDWAFLGFQPNAAVAMLQMGESIRRTFPVDYYGTPYEEIPMLESVVNYDQIPAVVTFASTAVGEFWAVYAGSRYGVTVVAGLTAVYTADIQPFYHSGQIAGILGGLKGAAEYEARIGRIGHGTAGMRSQKVVHFLIIAFVVLGNIAYINQRRRS